MSGPTRQNQRAQPPWEPGAEEGPSFGSWLRGQREMREVDLREIADTTKISIRYLEALEQDRFDILPAPVFAHGFLREYARFVGLNPDEVVNSYLTARNEHEPAEEPERERPSDSKTLSWPSTLLLVALALVLLSLVALLAYWAERRREPTPEPPPIAAPVVESFPAAVEEPIVAAEPAAPLRVTLDFIEDCWLEAWVDDASPVNKLYVQGEAETFDAESRVRLRLGNPAGVLIEANGKPWPVEPSRDGSVRTVEIDREAFESAAQEAG